MKLAAAFILLLFFFGCRPGSESKKQLVNESGKKQDSWRTQQYDDSTNFTKAVAVLQPASGSNIKGLVTFTKQGGLIKVVADITGLKPGKHGFHIHEYGDCSAPDGSLAGPHFSPMKHQHGAPTSQDRHEGDLGNITADASGKAHLEISDSVLSLTGVNSIIGRAVVVHEKEDDFTSQPAGNAGARLACGVIGISK